MDERSREARLRRTADRCGYHLRRSATRNPDAVDYGLYALIDVETGGAVNPAVADRWVCSWTLDDVEEWLNQ